MKLESATAMRLGEAEALTLILICFFISCECIRSDDEALIRREYRGRHEYFTL